MLTGCFCLWGSQGSLLGGGTVPSLFSSASRGVTPTPSQGYMSQLCVKDAFDAILGCLNEVIMSSVLHFQFYRV